MARTWYVVDPPVWVEFGPRSSLDTSVHPPRVDFFHAVFVGWLGDDLVQTFPCYLATEALACRLEASGLSGVAFNANLAVDQDPQMLEVLPEQGEAMPRKWRWFEPAGRPWIDDFWLGAGAELHASERGRSLLSQSSIAHAEIREAVGP